MVGRAAAAREEPEEAGCDGERRGDPHGGEEPRVQARGYAVELGRGLDGADDDGRSDGCEGRGGADGNGGDSGDQGRDAREGPTAVSKDAEEQLDAKRDVGDDEDDLGPADDGAEGVDGVGDFLGQGDVLAAGRVGDADQAVELRRRRVELLLRPVELRLGALPRPVLGSVAVVPDADII